MQFKTIFDCWLQLLVASMDTESVDLNAMTIDIYQIFWVRKDKNKNDSVLIEISYYKKNSSNSVKQTWATDH